MQDKPAPGPKPQPETLDDAALNQVTGGSKAGTGTADTVTGGQGNDSLPGMGPMAIM
jgi:hypothetical protein